MTNRKQRMDRLESSLTPTEAMLLWMAEAHAFETVEEYARHLKGKPDSAWPLHHLGNQMTASVEQALKGKPKPEINRAVRQAVHPLQVVGPDHRRLSLPPVAAKLPSFGNFCSVLRVVH